MSETIPYREEAKHITYVKDQTGGNHDLLVAKVQRHYADGRIEPHINLHHDYKRPFYVTKKGLQKHQDKKDFEYTKNLNKYMSTQLALSRSIVKITGDWSSGPDPYIKRLARSPYLYGTDVSSATILKSEYKERSPGLISVNTVSAGDIETSVHHDDEHIILLSVTFKDKVFLGVLESWIEGVEDPINRIKELSRAKIQPLVDADNIRQEGQPSYRGITDDSYEVLILPTPGTLVIEAMRRLHAWKPDFFTFWNMTFDIKRMVIALEREGIDPAIVFNEPSLPPEFKYFKFNEGSEQKVTSSGKTSAKNPEDVWPWADHTASFQIVDSMPIYRELRRAAGMDSSYRLDYILNKEINIGKLQFEDTDKYNPGTLRWHEVMQKDYKIEYAVYNVFDSISLELLDEKTKDLGFSISSFAKNGEYKTFNSNPKRLCDDMHFWYLNRPEPCVIGSSSDTMIQPIDDLVVNHQGWIK